MFSTMASTEGLVPITRSFLASYYDKCPFDPLSDDVTRLSSQLRSFSDSLLSEFPPDEGERELIDEANRSAPHKIEQNLWKNREHMEEIVFLLEKPNRPSQLREVSCPEGKELEGVFDHLKDRIQSTLAKLQSFQAKNADRVFNTVITYLPQDFRGTLIKQQRERSERNKQAEVDALISSGGSIRDKYALLWRQQMDRRQQLAQLGSASGVYKTLVKYLVGVPQVLLDFIQQINDDDGPMEEQRQRYGPPVFSLTAFILSIRLFISLSWGCMGRRKINKSEVEILEEAVKIYTSEFERYFTFMSEVFANSPFLISAADAGILEGRKNDEYQEIIVPAGKIHEVSLDVESLNSYIAWDFSLVQSTLSLDIGFCVECVNPKGERTLILPYQRYDSDQGNFCTLVAGNYKLIWDNSYSTFFKKTVRYKVDCIPPVVEPIKSPTELEQ